MTIDQHFMRLAIQEACKGIGRTSPNPCVGAVVVKDGEILSVGYHEKAGSPHAEVHAIRKAGTEVQGATIYVTLEPCNHTGKTPPCSHAILKSGIKRVVVGMEDPNPLVDGSGIAFLRQHGIEVDSGLLSKECENINRPFIKHITTSTPWVVMKAGVSLDGRLNYQKGESGWITGPQSLVHTHYLRDIHDAILVGIGTVIIDDPSLTTRPADGRKGKDPIRVILDSELRIPTTAKVFHLSSSAATWIFCGENVSETKLRQITALGGKVCPVRLADDGSLDLKEVLAVLGKEKIISVLVEGGAKVHGAMLQSGLVDHVNLFYAPLFAGDKGVSIIEDISTENKENAISLSDVQYKRFGEDLMVEGDVIYPS